MEATKPNENIKTHNHFLILQSDIASNIKTLNSYYLFIYLFIYLLALAIHSYFLIAFFEKPEAAGR